MRVSATPDHDIRLHPSGIVPVRIAATAAPRILAWHWTHCRHLPQDRPVYCMPYVMREHRDRMEAYLPADNEDRT
jgi:hypothetical protein